jgi:hypothetical protein
MNQPAHSRLLAHVLVAVALACGAQACLAGETQVKVSVTVAKHASLRVVSQPGAVVVTAADIQRGYVDVPVAAQVAVQSNTPGYLLDFASEGDFMRQIVVRGLGADVQLSPAGGVVTQTAPGNVKTTLALGFRFVLSDGAQPGAYPWPMRLAAQPL